ncbi:MAG: hypothetical protein LUD17_01840 [Bacteroidales bacterium]|nr:hypothetical protein [Bacteroidales bacterium]
MFYLSVGYPLDLKHPKTFCEKLNWLKLYDHNPLYTLLTDKVKVKDYITNKIGSEYLIPTIGVWDKVEDIDFEKLPNQFVIKCNHNSGIGLYVCRDKSFMDVEKVKHDLKDGLKENYYYRWREWPYKNIPRRILAEKYLTDDSGEDLRDYKFFCFDGVPRFMYVASDRNVSGEETKFDFFDMDFNHLPITNGHPNSSKEIGCPKFCDIIFEIC